VKLVPRKGRVLIERLESNDEAKLERTSSASPLLIHILAERARKGGTEPRRYAYGRISFTHPDTNTIKPGDVVFVDLWHSSAGPDDKRIEWGDMRLIEMPVADVLGVVA